MNFLLTPSGWQPTAGLPLEDRGFRYGMHIFETIFSHQGAWQDWSRHIQALQFHGRQAGFQTFDGAWELLQTPPLTPTNHLRARLFWTAGSGSPLDPPSPGTIVCTTELIPAVDLLPPHPLQITFASNPVPDLPFPAKSGNYWLRLSLLQQALSKGFEEALVFNSSGHWLGFCCGNGFARLGSEWFTPTLATGTRRGVTREKLLQLCPTIKETVLTKAELASAGSIIFASSRHGLRQVARLDDKALAQEIPVEFLP
jgi:branched-subunit amino acid aminotransferase/4-amino-4-deoxychorismate lyase